MNNSAIENQILIVFPSARKIDNKSIHDSFTIDDKTELYFFKINEKFKIGILLDIKHTGVKDYIYCKDIYVDFKYKNDSKLIDDESTWSSKLGEKVKFYSMVEILYLRWFKKTAHFFA